MPKNRTESAILGLAAERWYLGGRVEANLAALRTAARSRAFNLLEIGAVSMVYFWMVWSVVATIARQGLDMFPLLVNLATVIYVAFVSPVLLHRDSLASRGLGPPSAWFFRRDNLLPALRGFGGCTLAGSLALLLAGAFFRPGFLAEFDGVSFILRLSYYFFSAMGQNYLFLAFFLRRWQAVFQTDAPKTTESLSRSAPYSASWPILANALLFSFYHLPNLPVMVLTLGLGIVWSGLFNRTPNLVLAACGHAVLGTILNIGLHVKLHIGSAYFGGYKGFYRSVFAFLDPIIGGRF